MVDKPILFSAPMVRTLLAGTKTQTRRVLSNNRFASIFNGEWADSYVLDDGNADWRAKDIRFAVGDRLYVREAWRTVGAAGMLDTTPPRILDPQAIWYEADGEAPSNEFAGKFRQGMHMPRWGSRLTLLVTDVRVHRLQNISEEDAEAEGAEPLLVPPDGGSAPHVEGYRVLWDKINADRGFGWDTNPWVVAVSFVVVYCNIDEAA